MNEFVYVYVLRSQGDGFFYTGFSRDLRQQLREHQSEKVNATKKRLPLELVYYEACRNIPDAITREKYLKTAWGKRYIKTRLKGYLTG